MLSVLFSRDNNTLRVTTDDNGFQVLIESGDLYGPANGIYVVKGVDSARTIAKNMCITGGSYYVSGFHANPLLQPLITYNCSTVVTPPIVG